MCRLATLREIAIYSKREHAVSGIYHGLQIESGCNLLDSLPSIEKSHFSGFLISNG